MSDLSMSDLSFDAYVVVSFSLKLVAALIAVVAAVMVTRRLDIRAGTSFAVISAKIRENPLATSIYYGLRILAVMILVGMVMGCSTAHAANISGKYDRQIEAAVTNWWLDYPFPASWKAQLYQESRLRPDAVSPVGAAGLAQFMPGTWKQVARELRLPPGASATQDIAIDAGAYYMAKLRRAWSAQRPNEDRHQLAQASYNAGLGHLLSAQKRCGGAALYDEIIACLPAVTGHHSRETITYVQRIKHWRRLIETGL